MRAALVHAIVLTKLYRKILARSSQRQVEAARTAPPRLVRRGAGIVGIAAAPSNKDRSQPKREKTKEKSIMRKLLALITLSCAMAIGAGVSVTSANAATLTSAVHSLKAEQTSFVDKAYYRRYYHRRYYRRGFYHRRYYGGYYRRGYYGYGYHHRRRWY